MTEGVQKQIGLMVTFMEASKSGNKALAADIIQRAKEEGIHMTPGAASENSFPRDDHYSFVKNPDLKY